MYGSVRTNVKREERSYVCLISDKANEVTALAEAMLLRQIPSRRALVGSVLVCIGLYLAA